LLALFLVERFFSSHHHEEPFPEGQVSLSWSAAVVGMSLHTLANGVALASAVVAGQPNTTGGVLSFGVFFAIFLHKPADSLTVVTLLLSSGTTRRRAHLVNLLFAAIVPAGVVLFFLIRMVLGHNTPGPFTGGALAFSAGMFLCIALSDLLPELHFHHHDRVKLSVALLAGVGLMYLVSRLELHDHSPHEEHEATVGIPVMEENGTLGDREAISGWQNVDGHFLEASSPLPTISRPATNTRRTFRSRSRTSKSARLPASRLPNSPSQPATRAGVRVAMRTASQTGRPVNSTKVRTMWSIPRTLEASARPSGMTPTPS